MSNSKYYCFYIVSQIYDIKSGQTKTGFICNSFCIEVLIKQCFPALAPLAHNVTLLSFSV